VLVLAVDLFLLVLLAHMPIVAAFVLAGLVLAAFIARPEWFLAFFLMGAPLLTPLKLIGGEQLALFIALRLLFVIAWLGAITRAGAIVRHRMLRQMLSDPITITVLLLALLLWAGLARTPAPEYGAGKAKSFLVANVFLFFAPLLLWPLWRARARLDRFLRGAVAVGMIFAAIGVLVALGWVGSGREGPDVGRLAWLGTSPIWVARLLAIWIVLLLWTAARRRLSRGVAITLGLLGLWLLLRTGSRGPLIALVVCPFALLLLPRRESAARVLRILALRVAPALLVAGLLLFVLLPGGSRERLLAVLARTPVGALAGDAGGMFLRDPSLVYRNQILQRGWVATVDALPWGGGTGAFPALLFLRDFTLYPHNIEIELLIEQGWVGFAAFVVFLGLTWRRARALNRRDDCGAWLFALFAMAWVNAQVSGDVAGNAEIWFWAGMIAGCERAARAPATVRTGCDGRHEDLARESG
jgi:O-antigen ligase